MTPADIESEASDLEWSARSCLRTAKGSMDDALRFKALAEERAREAAADSGAAGGKFFRADELRYDARGGMTEALERRRFEPGARWSCHGTVLEVARQSYFHGSPWVHLRSATLAQEFGEMTRANGWMFLGLSDQGGYR